MGCCWIAGKENGGYTKSECADAQGTWAETCSWDKKEDTSSCFITTILTRSLGQAILDLGKTYQSQVDFRDKVLATSPLGKKMIKLYYQHNPTMLAIAMNNYELLGDAMKTWTSILNFVKATVELADGGREAVSPAHARLKYTKGQHARIVKLMGRFLEESKSQEFHTALNDVKEELAGYVGLTPEQAVERMRRKASREKK